MYLLQCNFNEDLEIQSLLYGVVGVIHHNQTGYVEDRYIGGTIRSIFHIMEFRDFKNIPGILIFIDFKKAFDSLECT